MAHEVETKILEVNKETLEARLNQLGAEKIFNDRLVVDWYGPKGLTHNGDDPWFLRIRSYGSGRSEVTWKGQSEILGASRKHKEINFAISDLKKFSDLLLGLDLEKYAHQEKDRISWTYQDFRFDLDQYPNMPAYLEIEASSEESVQQAIKLLGLESLETSSEGERVLIQDRYKFNWFDMKF